MEAENNTELNVPAGQEADNRINKPIGNIEQEKLQPKPVLVKNAFIKVQSNKKGDKVGDIVELECKHPDKDETIPITKVIYEKDSKLKESGLWYNEDKEGNLQKGSALASTIEYFKANNVSELFGKELQTKVNDAGYLAIKAY